MSDLVRGIVREPTPPVDALSGPAAPLSRPPQPDPAPEPAVPRAESSPAPVEPPAPAAPAEDPQALFGDLQHALESLHGLVRAGDGFPWRRLEALMDRAIDALHASGDLFWVANSPAPSPGLDYLAFHQARVAVLALRIGADSGYDRTRLLTLGLAGCLMDVGLWALPETILRRGDALTGDELAQYRSHPRLSAEIIRRWGPPDDRIVDAVLAHHEREQGQGFPQGLSGPAIEHEAKILGLVDTYAGLTAPSSGRPRLRPHEAIRDIVKLRHDLFPPALIKALLSEISVFPPGTVVRLNTEEIGRVTAVNRHHPLRPRVEVLADSKGQRLASVKLIDLSEMPFLYITGPVAEGSR